MALVAGTTLATPLPTQNNDNELPARAADAVQQLIAIAPTSNTCIGASFPDECSVSSATVVNALLAGFTTYSITTAAEQAALLSWMAFESGDFKFNRNHFPAPGRPGQGTRAMLMPNFVAEYAASIPELAPQVAAAAGDPAKVLELVQPDQYAWAAASWYYATKCSTEQRAMVVDGGLQGWQNGFITGCVQTANSPERQAYWTRARQALGAPV
ncbi:uncharacterized protein A1O9_09214 [Exophiala aquamarina CBS 119918]|uniref:Transglycosylase SLT domain-containing protein n=1 Tax=Exophiala aquamarina CBS 119918 TaxID=1182545 RepID=A0A072P509_9EURO|nr:uncharacterized protein A1O9_09214 [Exophiala aquamarina CBS 119918]KEF54772.1 hypothetical protein A1O9_09214 [Exophiala aquamarina CBS 119918]